MRVTQFQQIRRLSQQALERLRPIPADSLVWRANEDDPSKHNIAHEGLIYELPEDKMQLTRIFSGKGPYDNVTSSYYSNLRTLPLMIRKPALTAMEYLKRADSSTPNVRILFYGDRGHGKTHTLVHLTHYIHQTQQFFIVHLKNMRRHIRSPRGYEESTSRPGRIDTPVDAAILLHRFRTQNDTLLEKHANDLVCSSTYNWSVRESTEAGQPLVKVVEHGLNRLNHASDCYAVLLKELVLAADSGKIRLATLLDNTWQLFQERAGVIRHKDLKYIMVDEITIARAIKKVIKGTQRGSFVLATCEDELGDKQNQTPQEGLGFEGWNHFDPCLPIHVPKYSRREFEVCMNFYQDIGWLGRPESRTQEARDEIRFISGLNPGEVAKLCSTL